MNKLIEILISHISWGRLLYNKLLFSYKKVSYTNFPKINGKLYIRGKGKTFFGKRIAINSGTSSNPLGGDTRIVIKVFPDAVLNIGDYTGISKSPIICQNQITIDSNVKIGENVKIYDTNFHALNYEDRKDKKTDVPVTKEIKRSNHSFIGTHSIILKGVTIGKKLIIGAGSVVTKSVPDGEMWGSHPAKFIKRIK